MSAIRNSPAMEPGWEGWDRVADVVVVGSGAAGYAAALRARSDGAEVVMLERADRPGGTTALSGGGFWIPNNSVMRRRGLEDPRDAALRYMARLAFPQRYYPEGPTLGLPAGDFTLLEAFYENGAPAIDALIQMRALFIDPDFTYPDYHSDLPEDAAPLGRTLAPVAHPDSQITAGDESGLIGGALMVESMHKKADDLGIPLLCNHRVVHVVRNEAEEVVGVETQAGRGRGTVLVGARKGVVFATGGFLHNPELRQAFLRGPAFGGVAAASNTGDFVAIGAELGARLGNMSHAWWDQLVLEVALRSSGVTTEDVWLPFGDSMVQVNRFGRRVVNEKMVYNERSQVHFTWDPSRREYPNLLLFQIYDDNVAQDPTPWVFRGPVPMPDQQVDYVISGETLAELAHNIDKRLASLAQHTGGVRLDPDFIAELERSLARFNEFADSGIDEDFARGATEIQRAWQGPSRSTSTNPCMARFRSTGPYHCIILAAGALDTKGGPVINEHAEVLTSAGIPIPGLYGAGNCVASPAGQAYWGAGGTLGPALAFGYIAGGRAAADTAREP
ncbi:FAD-dependent oxidoreductase [[Mycobacterium] vasticus]|uniref:FAD-dependent oxidoreductase n=1 Tax=[Mycobacterium] vasticus TaxID=2875777 RepID=A0ABU5Z624_9MYCO|nr:FAD-dependent oxidoreductase [Mycolicibacter sp. MYC017]MEB3071674.1 FAD-dependent oxidoreductase [Mycolicibacter sp. MYC017]